jgi:hypothetical protein
VIVREYLRVDSFEGHLFAITIKIMKISIMAPSAFFVFFLGWSAEVTLLTRFRSIIDLGSLFQHLWLFISLIHSLKFIHAQLVTLSVILLDLYL